MGAGVRHRYGLPAEAHVAFTGPDHVVFTGPDHVVFTGPDHIALKVLIIRSTGTAES